MWMRDKKTSIYRQGEIEKQEWSKAVSRRNWIQNKQQIMESGQVSVGAQDILRCNDALGVSSAQTQPAYLIRLLLWKVDLPECLILLVFSGNSWCFSLKGTRFLLEDFSQGAYIH